MVLNPRRRRRRRAATTHHRRRRRRNPVALRSSHRRHVRRRRHRNPSLRGLMRGGKVLGLPLAEGGMIAVGAIVSKVGANLANKLPLPEFPGKKYAVQAAATLAAAFLIGKANRRLGNAVATGGTVAIVLSLVQDFVAPHVPMLAEYEQPYWQGPGVQAYLPTMSDGTQWQPSMG
jgi:hypothetical protein